MAANAGVGIKAFDLLKLLGCERLSSRASGCGAASVRGPASAFAETTWPGSEESNLPPDEGRLGGCRREFGDYPGIEVPGC